MAFVTTLLAIIGLALILVVIAALRSTGPPPEGPQPVPPHRGDGEDGAHDDDSSHAPPAS